MENLDLSLPSTENFTLDSPEVNQQSWLVESSQVLSAQDLRQFNTKSNIQGVGQLLGHLAVIVLSGYLWSMPAWPLALLALPIYGFSIAAMFAPVHECVHRTAFASQRLNDVVGWFAGLLSFYNATYYRRYHKWHHRYTRVPGKDPELTDPTPTNIWQYILELSGFHWWTGKILGHGQIALGQLDAPFVSESAKVEVVRSTRLQLLVYLVAIFLSIFFRQPWFLTYWLLPLAVGQPILRFILLAEHTGCSLDNNMLTNTRTTLTLMPLRFLMWNMPFHAEHHLYPSIPFHRLPTAREQLRSHIAHLDPGYIAVNRNIVASFSQL
jgi:fatty acid desaturase